ncbi:hypothetical protein [Acetomicrobium sp.]|uniref:hypothetical protein n=1 Tax=Acetomicrobium sp. TaxID=1872099 RepID=UPI002FCC8584
MGDVLARRKRACRHNRVSAAVYAHRSNYGRTEVGLRFNRAVETTVSYAENVFGRPLMECPAFGGLCDLSYIGCEIDKGERQTATKDNTPGWGIIYGLPLI